MFYIQTKVLSNVNSKHTFLSIFKLNSVHYKTNMQIKIFMLWNDKKISVNLGESNVFLNHISTFISGYIHCHTMP